ncbi:hypothetical protein MKC98_09115, partial [[Clostridium] innocuum]|nr:hypothetical protein [[Clostridium] innocuum]MCR0597588.1 hypothetical protein [[Clostridium] innocuum]
HKVLDLLCRNKRCVHSIFPPVSMFRIYILTRFLLFTHLLLYSLQMSLTAWIIYILMTTLATLSCAMIGMIFGIYAKNQMNANSVVTPAVLILMLIPMFADLMPIMAILSNYLFTGVVIESINSLTYNSIIVTPMQWTVLLIECVLSIIAFLFLYKKNGFEA